MFSEEAPLVSVNLLLGLIIDLLFALSIGEIVPRLPAKATDTTARTTTHKRALNSD